MICARGAVPLRLTAISSIARTAAAVLAAITRRAAGGMSTCSIGRGTGFESIGQDAVPELGARELVVIVRVVCRKIRQCEQLARVDIEHDNAARFRPVLSDRGFQLAVSEVLDANIQSKGEVVPVLRGLDRFDVLDRLAESVLDQPSAAGLAGEPVLKREFDALLADVVRAGEAERLRSDFAARVIAPVLAVLE